MAVTPLLASQWRRLGVGVSTLLRVGGAHDGASAPTAVTPLQQTARDGDGVRAARPLLAGCTLAVLPDSALWTVNALADADMSGGLTPHPADFVATLTRVCADEAVDEAYMAHCLALRCFTHPTCYFATRVRAYEAATAADSDDDDEAMAARVRVWLRAIAEDAATAPLSCVAAARRYVRACALRLPAARDDVDEAAAASSSSSLPARRRCAVAPLVDLLVRDDDDAAVNVTLCAATAADALASLTCVRGARQYLRGKDDAYRYWLLRTSRAIAADEPLRLSRHLASSPPP